MIELTESHKRRIEEQLNEMGYENVEFQMIDEHPCSSTDKVLVWFVEDKPKAKPQYKLAKLDFAASCPPYLDISFEV